MIMTVNGDLIELIGTNLIPQNEQIEIKSIPWELNDEAKFPIETFSLYSIDFGVITIKELKNIIFDGIEKSSFSRVSTHIHAHEELFILFFEFAIEKYENEYEFIHFGIVPTSDFFNLISSKPIIKIRHKYFQLKQSSIDNIQEKIKEFKTKFPDNSLF